MSTRKPYVFFLLIIIVGVLSLVQAQTIVPVPLSQSPETTAEIPLDISVYDPQKYGVPEFIGGFEVLAVRSSNNSRCLPDGLIEIVIRSPDTTMDAFLNSGTSQTVTEELSQLGISNANLQFVSPDTDKLKFLQANEIWNDEYQNGGCVSSGGPLIVIEK